MSGELEIEQRSAKAFVEAASTVAVDSTTDGRRNRRGPADGAGRDGREARHAGRRLYFGRRKGQRDVHDAARGVRFVPLRAARQLPHARRPRLAVRQRPHLGLEAEPKPRAHRGHVEAEGARVHGHRHDAASSRSDRSSQDTAADRSRSRHRPAAREHEGAARCARPPGRRAAVRGLVLEVEQAHGLLRPASRHREDLRLL